MAALYVASGTGILRYDGTTFSAPGSLSSANVGSALTIGPFGYIYWSEPGGYVYSYNPATDTVTSIRTGSGGEQVPRLIYNSDLDVLYALISDVPDATVEYWDGVSWTAVGGTLTSTGGGSISLLEMADDGTLYVIIPNEDAGNVTKAYTWNGSSWVIDAIIATGNMIAVGTAAWGNDVYVFFNENSTGVLAKRRSGTWSDISPALTGTMKAAVVHDGALFVGYNNAGFTRIEIWKYDGASWSMDFDSIADNPSSTFAFFTSLFSWFGQLYAGVEASGSDYFPRRSALGVWSHVSLTPYSDAYRFGGSPNAFDLNPTSGDIRGGEAVSIIGSGFDSAKLYQIRLGDSDEGVVAEYVSATELTFVTKAHAIGVVDALLLEDETVYGEVANAYEYTDDIFPHINTFDEDGSDGIVPDNGPITGSTPVTITGRNFLPGATILFDGLPATSVVFVSSTQYTCVTPAHQVGAVDVSIILP